jgi:hypothetical protein
MAWPASFHSGRIRCYRFPFLAVNQVDSAAPAAAPRNHPMAVRVIPKSGRTSEDVLAYVHLSAPEVVEDARVARVA